MHGSFTIYRHFCTRPLAVGGFVVRFRRFPCSCSFRQKVSTNFGPRVRGRLGGLAPSGKAARARVCRAERIYALASVCLTWRTGEFPSRFLAADRVWPSFLSSREKRPGEGRILGAKQSRRSRVYDFASKTLQWCRSCLRRGFMRGWLPDNALNCDDASGRWRSRKRLRPQRAGIPCQSRMPHRPSSLERSLLPACWWPLRCRKAYR